MNGFDDQGGPPVDWWDTISRDAIHALRKLSGPVTPLVRVQNRSIDFEPSQPFSRTPNALHNRKKATSVLSPPQNS
jgi:hypothetical protein